MRKVQKSLFAEALVRANDTGMYDDMLSDELRLNIREGTIFGYLDHKLGPEIAFNDGMKADLLAEWQQIETDPIMAEKVGSGQNGLSLLLAYMTEGVLRRASPST